MLKHLVRSALIGAFALGAVFLGNTVEAATLNTASTTTLPGTSYKMVSHTIGDTNYLLVAGGGDGLHVYTVTEDAVTLTGTVDTPGNARDVVAGGNYAYVADGSAGVNGHVFVIDISTASNPSIVGDYSKFGGNFRSVELNGTTLYAGDTASGIHGINVSTPTSPTQLFNYTDGIAMVDLEYKDGKLYGLQPSLGLLYVVNVADVNAISLVKTWFVDTTANEILVKGSTVHVSNGEAGIEFIGVDTTTEAQLLAQVQYNTPGSVESLDFVGSSSSLAFVADGSAGVKLVNTENNANVKLVASSTSTALEGTIDTATIGSDLFAMTSGSILRVNPKYSFDVEGSKSSKKEKVTVTEGGEAWCTITPSDKKVGAQAFLADMDGDGKSLEIVEAPKAATKKAKVRIYDAVTCELIKKKKIDDSDKKRQYKVRAGNYYGSDTSRDEIVAVRVYEKEETPKVQLHAFFYNVDSNKIKLKKKKAYDAPSKFVSQGVKVKIKEGKKYPVRVIAKDDSDTKESFKLKKKDGEFKWNKK